MQDFVPPRLYLLPCRLQERVGLAVLPSQVSRAAPLQSGEEAAQCCRKRPQGLAVPRPPEPQCLVNVCSVDAARVVFAVR
eukprot:7145056-Lingulodinium_polyedra.AAC.1